MRPPRPVRLARRQAPLARRARAAALAFGVLAGPADAIDRRLELVSGGNANRPAIFRGATADGTRVFFVTDEALLPGDTDTDRDLYERTSDGTLRLIGGATCCGIDGPTFRHVSADGGRVVFVTDMALLPADTDTADDLYEQASDGALRLVSVGSADLGAAFAGAMADGSRVFFLTAEALLPTDTDTAGDLYEHASGGALRLVSEGTTVSVTGPAAVSADGSRVFFSTTEALLPTDTDTARDVYERASDGGLRQVTGGSANLDVIFAGISVDGSRVLFVALEALLPADTDTALDVYVATRDALRLVTVGSLDAILADASADASRVFFRTAQALLPADTDTADDLYERASDGALRLVSGGSANLGVLGARVSEDGSHVFFLTAEALLPADTDTADDLYERVSDGAFRLVSGGTANLDVSVPEVSADGSRVFFVTTEALLPADTDTVLDVYAAVPLAPEATTGAASDVGATGVTLGGLVDPHGQAATYRFEFGLTSALGETTADASTGTQSGAEVVAAPLTGLEPGTTYHYRLVATNTGGTTVGETLTVTTADPCATCDDGNRCTVDTCSIEDGCAPEALALEAVGATLSRGIEATLVSGVCNSVRAAERVSGLVRAAGIWLVRADRADRAARARAARRQLRQARRQLSRAATVVQRARGLPAGCGAGLGTRVAEAKAQVECLLAAR